MSVKKITLRTGWIGHGLEIKRLPKIIIANINDHFK